MAQGPGKYDDLATYIRSRTKARAAIVAVVHGNKGSGFSIQVESDYMLDLPKLLRTIADEIEESK